MIRNDTVAYYDNPDNNYATKTINADMSQVYSHFLKYLPEKASILDAGCGSGRDSLFFINEGFVVTAIDASKVMCDAASKTINQPVLHQNFYEINFDHCFDGIWACATLLHLDINDIASTMKKLAKDLVPGGIFYVSFKYGNFSGERNGRFFTDMTEKSFAEVISKIEGLTVIKQMITEDARPDRNEKWLNVFLKKE